MPVAQGKRVGPKKKRSNLRPATLLLSLGITRGVIAWGYLVKAAIVFGPTSQKISTTTVSVNVAASTTP